MTRLYSIKTQLQLCKRLELDTFDKFQFLFLTNLITSTTPVDVKSGEVRTVFAKIFRGEFYVLDDVTSLVAKYNFDKVEEKI